MKAKEEGDNEMVAAIKLAINGSLFGKSNSEYSPMYDTAFMLSITINGQLLLSMLAEKIADNDISIIQINTDGILVNCPNDKEDILKDICNRWMSMTKLSLDYDYFKFFAQRDINNYIGILKDGKFKYKGAFEIDKDWHKNHSKKIVAIAIKEYYEKGTPVRETIENHKDIYDFCISQKVSSNFHVEYHYEKRGIKIEETVQRINRYYVSNYGGSLLKVKEDGSTTRLVAGNAITLFNKYFESDNYDINYDFYVSQANKIINTIDNGQISLFN